jgi:formylglycine-generating enzyme required for sulfatase activity
MMWRQTRTTEVARGGDGPQGARASRLAFKTRTARLSAVSFVLACVVFGLTHTGLSQLRNSRRIRTSPTPAPPRPHPTGERPHNKLKTTPQPVTWPSLTDQEFFTLSINPDGVIPRASVRTLHAETFNEDLGRGVSIEMVMIPAGSFMMGTGAAEVEQVQSEYARYCDTDDCRRAAAATVGAERPQHSVSVPAFAMGMWEVTRAQWDAVARLPKVKIDISHALLGKSNPDDPVRRISWYEAVEFCERLSKKTGRKYRLPTEAEWEYACRAGSSGQFAFGDTINSDFINYNGQYPYGAAPLGINRRAPRQVSVARAANAFGLFDTHGNVSEWCQDAWHNNYDGAPAQGAVWERGGKGDERVTRGGSWDNEGYKCRSAFREKQRASDHLPTLGLRVVVNAPGVKQGGARSD